MQKGSKNKRSDLHMASGTFCVSVVHGLERLCALKPHALLPFVSATLEAHCACASDIDRVKVLQVPSFFVMTKLLIAVPISHLIQNAVKSICSSESGIDPEFPSLHSLAACAFLAHSISVDASPDGCVRRQALALFNRNKDLLDCSGYLINAIIDLAINPGTGCENETTAQNVLLMLMTHAAGDAAPGLKLQSRAFINNVSHHPQLNALTLHVLKSRPVVFFCDFFYSVCQLGHTVPPSFHPDIASTLRRAIMIARSDSAIQQATLCYFELSGLEQCAAMAADSQFTSNSSSESNTIAVALVSMDGQNKRLLKSGPCNSPAQPVFMFPVDVVAYATALPSIFQRLPSAAHRALSCLLYTSPSPET